MDQVRGITNKSSGKMGLELAKEAYIRGADLTLIVANVSVRIPPMFDVINVGTSKEMNEAIVNAVSDYDIFISTAAVSDFEFKQRFDNKIDSSSSIYLNLEPTTKIIRQIKKINPNIFLVGFKGNLLFQRKTLLNALKNKLKMPEQILLWPTIFLTTAVISDLISMKC